MAIMGQYWSIFTVCSISSLRGDH